LVAALSSIFYFLSQHSLLSMPLIVLLFLGIGFLLSRMTGNPVWYGMGILGFVGGMVNVFAASSVNALFLNAFGTYGTAMVTNAEETSSQLNDQNIWRYDAVMTTADGRDVKTGFDTMSISLYPPRNAIEVPPTGERFVIKYIPGFERNIAVMRDESAFGQRLLMQEARVPVEKARNQLRASPDNPDFRAEYRAALRAFLKDYGSAAPESVVEEYRRELAALAPE
jgi:hypothetical protein